MRLVGKGRTVPEAGDGRRRGLGRIPGAVGAARKVRLGLARAEPRAADPSNVSYTLLLESLILKPQMRWPLAAGATLGTAVGLGYSGMRVNDAVIGKSSFPFGGGRS